MIIDYIKLKKPFVRWIPGLRWQSNIHEVEIEITTLCNLRCYNCDRSARQAPSEECMSVSQVKKFITESIDLNWKWKQITLIGGEPTLHPQIFEILEIVKQYKKIYSDCKIEIATNGSGDKVNHIICNLPTWFSVKNSNKKTIVHNFCSYNVAPIDCEEYHGSDFLKGCWITTACGLGLTKYGYYACGAGASVDRVFGFDIGLKSLVKVNKTALRGQMNKLCKYCGHYKKNFNTRRILSEEISPSWQAAYLAYSKNKPRLAEY